MRKLVLSLGLAASLASTAAAQQPMPWNTEIGVRSVAGKLDVDGTGVTLIQLPAGSGVEGFGGGSALYAVFPVGKRFAIEPTFGLTDQSLGTNITTVNAGVRVLFSAWRGVYLAAGPSVDLLKFSGEEDARFGGQVAAGYRFPIAGAVTGRAELFYASVGEGEVLATQSSSTIGLAFGLGMGLGERPAARGARRASDRMWDFALGVQGGYTHTTIPGTIDLGAFSLLGAGSNMNPLFGFPLTTMNPWFVQIPVGERFAVEPSFSYNSFSIEDDGGTGSAYDLGLRLNYAFNRVVYAGVSAEMNGLGGDLPDDAGATGFGVAAGLRFPLVAGLKGRTELSYRTFSAGDNHPFSDYQVSGVSFGITAPLN